MKNVQIFLEVAAWLHLCQVPGTWFLAKRVVYLQAEVERLQPLAAAIVQVLGLAVVIVLVTLGILIGSYPGDVLATRFGFALCGFLGVFWLVRLAVQFWYYYGLPWPRSPSGRAAHAALVFIFSAQSFAYLAVCLSRAS